MFHSLKSVMNISADKKQVHMSSCEHLLAPFSICMAEGNGRHSGNVTVSKPQYHIQILFSCLAVAAHSIKASFFSACRPITPSAKRY